MEIKFSIVVPVFNCEKYVDSCVQSIINQSFLNWELILVNDGSTDSSSLICEKYALVDGRIKIINQINSGPFSARENGFYNTNGTYVIFVDSDDFLTSNCLEELSKIISKTNPDLVIFSYFFYENECYIENDLKLSSGHYEGDSISIIKKSILKNESNMLWNKCFKRDIYYEDDGAKIDKSSIIEEDLLMSLRFFDRAKKIDIVDNRLYVYRQIETSTMHQAIDLAHLDKKINPSSTSVLTYYAAKWNLLNDCLFNIYETKFDTLYKLIIGMYIEYGWMTLKTQIKKRDLLNLIDDKAKDMLDKVYLPIRKRVLLVLVKKKRFLFLHLFFVISKIIKRDVFKNRRDK